jgi:hypothetical protein
MKRIILVLLTMVSQSFAATVFECSSDDATVVSNEGDFDKFTLKGESKGAVLRNLNLTFQRFEERNALYVQLSAVPGDANVDTFSLTDNQDFRYILRLPKSLSQEFQAEVSLYNQGEYFAKTALSCTLHQY